MIEKLKAMIEDEEQGAEDYMEFADELDKEYPDAGYGSIIRTMAHEESVHHQHLVDILADMQKRCGTKK